MKKENRAFKGVWIPAEIWLSKNLSITEKVFLAEINSLDNKDGCFASNQYFSDFFELSSTRCSHIITSLKKKGFISRKVIFEDGTKVVKKRILRIIDKSYPLADMTIPPCENDYNPLADMTIPPCENDQYNNTKSNNIKSNNIKEKKDFSFSDEDTNISKTPLRKKRQSSQIKKQDYVQEQKQTFIKQIEEIYPKQFTDKEGFRRLEKFYDTKILSKDSQDKTNNNQTTFIKNLEACLELKQDYMFHLKNYIGTDSKKSKNYHEENFIEKLEASKKSKRPERKKHNALDHYAYSGNAAQEMMEAEEKARKLWEETGEQSPGFIFGL